MNIDGQYARLPDDMLLKMIQEADDLAAKIADRLDNDADKYQAARDLLRGNRRIRMIRDESHTDSIMCADGAFVVDQKLGVDMILALAVGVDGLGKSMSESWPEEARQYQYWQDALPHHVANSRLAQGLMFLMELDILAGNDREIRIMDGSHLTCILKLNSLLNPSEEYAGPAYAESLREFLAKKYERVIPDIPDMIKSAFTNKRIISLSKYSSSRELVNTDLKELELQSDDKTVMSHVLEEGEFTEPLPVGQDEKERKMWEDIHIKSQLPLEDVNQAKLNGMLDQAVSHFKAGGGEESDLYFSYFRPHDFTGCVRLELKKELATNPDDREFFLSSIRNQIKSAEIIEPFPQFMADQMAKSIRLSASSLEQAMYNHPRMRSHLKMLLPYRTAS